MFRWSSGLLRIGLCVCAASSAFVVARTASAACVLQTHDTTFYFIGGNGACKEWLTEF